ncbi:hypothetical protein BpHYR1_039382 [Brachionus plicatilis]|uniref:Uncharacterized protein n=1 Tax=Brachionus plicatilis TaxID=10195 RepID=A0A3M7SUA7_BRAPC|nr:hypothetical protein BpHYR1_039382 [Brachionus plicatilis]
MTTNNSITEKKYCSDQKNFVVLGFDVLKVEFIIYQNFRSMPLNFFKHLIGRPPHGRFLFRPIVGRPPHGLLNLAGHFTVGPSVGRGLAG